MAKRMSLEEAIKWMDDHGFEVEKTETGYKSSFAGIMMQRTYENGYALVKHVKSQIEDLEQASRRDAQMQMAIEGRFC